MGVLLGREERSLEGDYALLGAGLSRDYALREYLPGERIPPEVEALLVLGGTGLAEADLRPLRRYVAEGGRALFAVKGLRVETVRSFAAAAVGPSPLLELLRSYGVEVGRGMVLDPVCREYRLPQQAGGRIAWESLGPYPPWVSVRGPGVSPDHPVTAGFAGLDLLWPSPLEPLPVEGVRARSRWRSSSSASWVAQEPFVIDPFRVPRSGAPAGARVLALALSGRFPPGPCRGPWSFLRKPRKREAFRRAWWWSATTTSPPT